MDNKKLIIFYKSYVLTHIHKRLVELNNIKSIDEVDEILKYHAGFNTQASCKEMTKEDLQELIAWSFQFGDELGLKLNYKDNEWQKIYDNEEI
jgi:hypothetical protein